MNTVLQYCHLYKLVHLTSNFPLADKFTYEGYRWAVGVVLSRQNEVPVAAPAGESAASSSSAAAPDTVNVIALIPVWDLLNHSDACQKVRLMPGSGFVGMLLIGLRWFRLQHSLIVHRTTWNATRPCLLKKENRYSFSMALAHHLNCSNTLALLSVIIELITIAVMPNCECLSPPTSKLVCLSTVTYLFVANRLRSDDPLAPAKQALFRISNVNL
jgi:hypothetical protein